jgi:hypothetical protein
LSVFFFFGNGGNKLNTAFITLGWNFDINIGRATLEACNATWNVLTNPQWLKKKEVIKNSRKGCEKGKL